MSPIQIAARLATAEEVLPLRMKHRQEMNCQIVHDSIHRRPGWAKMFLMEAAGNEVAFGTVAIAGPWKDKPTIFEFYVVPESRTRSFEIFECFLATAGASFFEVQSNDALLTVMFHAYGEKIATEKIVFQDGLTTHLPANGAILKSVTPMAEIAASIEERQGGGEWQLELNGEVIGKGGILFHYNRPYGDIYMEINERFRKRGFGSYLVQELKRECHKLGAVPAARCSPANVASRQTLQNAGMVPFAHILNGVIDRQAMRQQRK